MIDTVLNYSIKWTDAFSLRNASFKGKENFLRVISRLCFVLVVLVCSTVNIILHRTNTSLEVFCIERILQYFLGTTLLSRFDVEIK